jgi:hypothetical protein
MNTIELLGWTQYFSSFQIYHVVSKEVHMNKIKEELGFDKFKQVLFFDDDSFNQKNTAKLGLTFYLVDQSTGVDMEAMIRGLELFDSKH